MGWLTILGIAIGDFEGGAALIRKVGAVVFLVVANSVCRGIEVALSGN